MDIQKLDVLAKKVDKALEIISNLTNENGDLHEKNRQLLSRVEELEASLNGAHGELEELSLQVGEKDGRLTEASEKLEMLLSSLDSIELDSEESHSDQEEVCEENHTEEHQEHHHEY
jgi:peptidoglycan hydrolase CwlO-like protein